MDTVGLVVCVCGGNGNHLTMAAVPWFSHSCSLVESSVLLPLRSHLGAGREVLVPSIS